MMCMLNVFPIIYTSAHTSLGAFNIDYCAIEDDENLLALKER